MMREAGSSDSIALLTDYLRFYSGYVREAALDRAAVLGTPALLPEVAKRLNDWVTPIRDKARDAVLSMLARIDPATETEIAMALLLQVGHLRHARRADHAAWIARFELAFIDVMEPRRIVGAIGSPQGSPAQACFVLARTYRLADPATLCRLALAHHGNVLLPRHAMELARSLPPDEQPALYHQALRSRVGLVRAQALRALLPDEPAPEVLAASMLADANVWVRMVASAFLAKRGVDVPAAYAHRIVSAGNDSPALRASLAGLAESGGARYLHLVHACTSHRLARVQAAAFMAWLALAPAGKDEIALRVLRSPHPRVRRLFNTIVKKAGAYVPADVALPILHERGDHEQMLGLDVGTPWDRLHVIATVACATYDNARFRRRLERELLRWFYQAERGYRQPSAAQRDFLRRQAVQQALLALLDQAPVEQRQLRRELAAVRGCRVSSPRKLRPQARSTPRPADPVRPSRLARGLVRALILRSSSANFSPRLISPASDLDRQSSMRLQMRYKRWRPPNFANLKRGEAGRIGIKFFGKLPPKKIFREPVKKHGFRRLRISARLALKHEGTNLQILAEAMPRIPAEDMLAELNRAPNGGYIRLACFLWEEFTGQELFPIPQIGDATHLLFDPERYITGS